MNPQCPPIPPRPRAHRPAIRLVAVRAAALVPAVLAIALPAVAVVPDAPVVRSEAPAEPPRTLTLVEEWRRGDLDDDLLFGMVIATTTDAEGNVYALDSQLSHVEVLSPAGEHLRTISGEGDGPGEVRAAQGMTLLPDGTLGLLKFLPAQIVRLDPDGTPRETIFVRPEAPEVVGNGQDDGRGFAVSFGIASGGGTIAVAAYRSTPSEEGQSRRMFLSRFSSEGEEVACYREHQAELDFHRFRFVEDDILTGFLLTFAVGPDGRVYVPHAHERYAIAVYAPDGTLERVIERPFAPRPRTARERNRLDTLIETWGRGIPYDIEREIHAHAPAIADLQVTDDGTLWVQHARSGTDRPDGAFMVLDTFAPDGTWLQEVTVMNGPGLDADPVHDGLRLVGEDRALVIKGHVLARWTSRNAREAVFDEPDAPESMQIVGCRVE